MLLHLKVPHFSSQKYLHRNKQSQKLRTQFRFVLRFRWFVNLILQITICNSNVFLLCHHFFVVDHDRSRCSWPEWSIPEGARALVCSKSHANQIIPYPKRWREKKWKKQLLLSWYVCVFMDKHCLVDATGHGHFAQKGNVSCTCVCPSAYFGSPDPLFTSVEEEILQVTNQMSCVFVCLSSI